MPIAAPATLSEYLNQWLDHIGPTRSTTTVRGYRFKIERISARLGNIRLDRLTAQHLDRALPAMARPRPPPQQRPPPPPGPFRRPASGRQVGPGRRGRHPACPPPRRSPTYRIPTPEAIQGLISTAERRGGLRPVRTRWMADPDQSGGSGSSNVAVAHPLSQTRQPNRPSADRPHGRADSFAAGNFSLRHQERRLRRRCHPVPSASGPARRDGRGDRTSVTPEVPPPPQTIGVPAPRRPRSVTHVPFPPRAPICAESVCLGR